MADERKIKIEDHTYSQWPHWLFIPVDQDLWNGLYPNLTRGWESIKRRQELTDKKVVFQFNRIWGEASGFFSGKRKIETWHRYKFKNKGDRLVFILTHIGENTQ
jgi:hypothetical protein